MLGAPQSGALLERLIDMDIGIDLYFSYVVPESPIMKSHLPLTSLFRL